MSKKRRNFTAEQKVALIRKHLIDLVSISDICEEFNINPTMFYSWQSKFFQNGAQAFSKSSSPLLKKAEDKSVRLESDMIQKNSVIAELVEENIKLKKNRGLI